MKTLKLEKVKIITEHYFSKAEQDIIEECIYSNSKNGHLETNKRILRILGKYYLFFEQQNYKNIFANLKIKLKEKHYNFLWGFLKIKSVTKYSKQLNIGKSAVSKKLSIVLKKICGEKTFNGLIDLILFLRNYNYEKRKKDFGI